MGKIVVSYWWTKINPLIYKGFLVRETGLEPSYGKRLILRRRRGVWNNTGRRCPAGAPR